MDAPRPGPENRRAPRDPVSFHARIEEQSAVRGQLLFVDMSPYGFMARTPASFAPGDLVTVAMPVVGRITARIVWSTAGRVGAEFPTPIANDDYDRLIASVS